MPKLRVYQLAKELQVQSALVLELLDRLGQEVRSDLSVLDPHIAEMVRDRVTKAIAVERERLATERTREQQLEKETGAPPDEAKVAASPVPEPTAETPKAPAVAPPPSPASPATPAPPATPVMAPRAPTARKPRVFPARRLVPHPSVRTAASRPAAAKSGAGVTRPRVLDCTRRPPAGFRTPRRSTVASAAATTRLGSALHRERRSWRRSNKSHATRKLWRYYEAFL